jgi:hypothetical protein
MRSLGASDMEMFETVRSVETAVATLRSWTPCAGLTARLNRGKASGRRLLLPVTS